MSHTQHNQSKNANIQLLEEKETHIQDKTFEDMHWVAEYLQGNYYLAHPLAIDKFRHLEGQIKAQKQRQQVEKDSKNQENQPKKQQNSVKSNINHMRPDSALSRQCKTQLNQVKLLKAKRDSQRKLIEEQEKYKAKFQQVKQNIEKRKQTKNGTDFIIKQQQKNSHKIQSANASMNQSRNNSKNQKEKSINISKAKQSIRYEKDKQKQIQQAPLNNFVSFQPHSHKGNSPKFGQNSKAGKSSQIKDNVRYSAQQKSNNASSQNKNPTNKSFVINSRKTPSQSKDYRRQTPFKKEGDKSLSSMTSKAQLENLNKKIKEMQQKLQMVQKRQVQLQKIEMSRVQQNEEHKFAKSRIVHEEQKQPNHIKSRVIFDQEKNSHQGSVVEYDQKDSEQQKIGTKIPSPSHKNYPIQKSAKLQQFVSSKKPSSSKKSEDGKRQTVFDIAISRNRQLNVSSEIYSYNNTEELKKKKEEEQKVNEKQVMSDEISNLKKTIRELKLERIKHEAIIEEFQKINKEQQRSNIDKQLKQKLKSEENERTINERSHKTTELNKETIQQKQKKNGRQQDLQQKIHNVAVEKSPKKNLRIQTKQDKVFHSRVSKKRLPSSNNPEDNTIFGKEYRPRSLSKKGIIVRQVMNPSNDSQMKIVSQSNADMSGMSNQLQPPSPTSTGRKLFELEFVHIDKQDSVVSEDIEINVPQIDIEGFPIPQLPAPPAPEINQAELLKLAKKICQLFEIDVDKDEHLYMKKYKNCIIFKTPDVKKTIVWHYSGKFYVGGWEQNQQGEGKKTGDGFEYLPDKHYYKGQFYNGKKNGSGIMIQENGNIYKGQWEGGEKHGQGKFFEKSTGLMYEGQWKNGKKDGKGVQKVSQKQYYDGTFVKSIKHGFGTEVFANGDLYHGQYKIGRFHGKGKYVWANGSSYDGQFQEGHREGQGKWKSCKKGGDKYSGSYKKDKKSGKGKYTWANGCIYDGQFLLDLKHGQGRVNYPDGRQAKGYWQHGKLVEIISQSKADDQFSSHYRQYDISMKSNRGGAVESASKQLQSSKGIYNV